MKHITKIAMAVLAATAIITTVIITESMNNKSVVTTSTTLSVINNEDFAGTATTKQFNIPEGFEYVKVNFKNTGSKAFTFTINQESTAGTAKMSYTVPADGKEHTYWSDQAWSTGWFYVSMSSAQGMSGKLSVCLGSDLNKLKSL
ncbi:phospholipase domain-containing protein [Paenibacillus taichungensis]|uniref:phospholipase domain-containing protein n=1 Tax=Paenibacillus taichungensis TaxID=484184 RepID=UPI0035E27067